MLSIAQIIGGLILLFIGGEVLIKGAVSFAKKLGLSNFVIGLTIVAYGTSSPELIISVKAALDGYPDIALGNVIGSNLSNILCVIGLTAIIYPINVDKSESGFDLKMMLIATIMLFIACLFTYINFITGAVFILVLIIYTIYTFKKQNSKTELEEIVDESEIELSTLKSSIFCIAGVVLLMLGADILVKGSVTIAILMGISEAVIGVTLVALGGSMPELITSVVAAWRKKSDIVLGNIIGSNLFNILGIIGTTSLIKPIAVDDKFLKFDLPALLITTIIIVAFVFTSNLITRSKGILLFGGYIFYICAQFIS